MRALDRRHRRLLRRATAAGWLEVWQAGHRRSLWFDDSILQSEIDLTRPGRLPNPANRAMLAHLIFCDRPRRVLLAGCGGGGIARWFAARSPDTAGVAVEVDPVVAAIAQEHFEFPGNGSAWQLVQTDVRVYLPNVRGFDWILVDIAEAGFAPAWVAAKRFLDACRAALAPGGVLTLNLIPRDAEDLAGKLLAVRRCFARRTLCLSVPGHDNVVAMAFQRTPELYDLEARAANAGRSWGLELPTFLCRLRHENPVGSGIF